MRGSVLLALITVLTLLGSSGSAFATIADKLNDYNRDGISDLVGITGDTGCMVGWSGTSNGGFANATESRCDGLGRYRGSFAAPGDLNRDGNGDLVAISRPDGCLVGWQGDGKRGFGNEVRLGTCTWGSYAGTLAGAGDLNNDGNGDLVAISSTGCLVRWFGTGSGGFGEGVQLGCGWGPYKGVMTGAGDLNNDGNSDLVGISRPDGCLVRWLGNGSGGFGDGVRVGTCTWGPYIAAGNLSGMGALTGDGHGDIVAVNTLSGCLVRWLGNGSGGFGEGVEVGCDWGRYFLAV